MGTHRTKVQTLASMEAWISTAHIQRSTVTEPQGSCHFSNSSTANSPEKACAHGEVLSVGEGQAFWTEADFLNLILGTLV